MAGVRLDDARRAGQGDVLAHEHGLGAGGDEQVHEPLRPAAVPPVGRSAAAPPSLRTSASATAATAAVTARTAASDLERERRTSAMVAGAGERPVNRTSGGGR